jgi:hypothetical protein
MAANDIPPPPPPPPGMERPEPYAPPQPSYQAPVNPPASPYAQPGQPGYGQPAYGQPADTPQGYGQQAYGYPVAPPKALSIISMVLGLVGLVFGFLFAIGAVVTGHIAARKEPYARGFWLTGIITGYAVLALWIVLMIVWVLLIAAYPNG